MKRLPFAALLLAATLAVTASAYAQATEEPPQDPIEESTEAMEPVITPPPPPPPTKESALVQASRAAKARKKSGQKPITNADVKKTKGKLAINSAKPKPVAEVDKPGGPSTMEKHEAQRRDLKEATALFDAAQLKVTEAEKELAQIEQRYYDESDPRFRDDVLQKRFEQAKRQVEKARTELADARDALAAVTPPKP